MSHTLDQIVADTLRHGALLGHGYGRTLTLEGRRRITIRVQSDVCRALYDASRIGAAEADSAFYPELFPRIVESVNRQRPLR